MTRNTTVGDKNLSKPNAKNSYDVTEEDLPLHCPTPGTSLWNSHPQVFIAFGKDGEGKCPYCGAEFHLKS